MPQSYFQTPQRPVIQVNNATISSNMSPWDKIYSNKFKGNCSIINQLVYKLQNEKKRQISFQF